jgi:hypothetical protein
MNDGCGVGREGISGGEPEVVKWDVSVGKGGVGIEEKSIG